MKLYLSSANEPNLQKIIITSAILHVLFITLAAVPLRTKDREYKSYFVNLVSPADAPRPARTPAPAAPEVKKDAPPAPEVKEVQKPVKKEAPAKPVLKKREAPAPKADMALERTDRVKKEIERLRAISAMEKMKKKNQERLAGAKASDEEIARAIAVIRKGRLQGPAAGQGIPGAKASDEYDPYYALVQSQVWSEWIYPDLDALGLEAIISIRIGKDGRVLSQEIEKSSGNILFDRSVTKAISKASPLPPPPVEMEIGLRFYL
ncbi:MAG: cell envelope integrity protein TolA [Nitrospiraceae bacterium]|nr:MAG: cell envelope integrity protein TolA [Nitrospiraceae bacterium]